MFKRLRDDEKDQQRFYVELKHCMITIAGIVRHQELKVWFKELIKTKNIVALYSTRRILNIRVVDADLEPYRLYIAHTQPTFLMFIK